MIWKGANICCLLEKRIGLWQNHFDLLVQEGEHYDQAFCQTYCHSVVDEESVIRVFTKLMLHGKVKAAVCWATERTNGVVLSLANLVYGPITVMDVLYQKHPAPSSRSDPLLQLEDIEINGSHILYAAWKIQ